MDLKELARIAAISNGLDPDVFTTQINTESSFNPKAVSPAGARGLGQFMPETGARYGLKTEEDFFNPEKSLNASARHMKDLMEANGGNMSLALAAYNAGQGAVNKHGGIPPYKETQNYVSKIMNRKTPDVSAGPMSGPNALQRQPQPQQQRNPLGGLMQMGIMESLLSGGQQQDPNGLGALFNDPMVQLGSNILANSGRGNFMSNVGKGLKAASNQQLVRDTAQNKQKSNFIQNYLKINEAMSGDPTSAMQNYEYLIAQGLSPQEATDRAFKQGTTVNVGAGVPSGYRPIHPLRPEAGLEPIPGGPATKTTEGQRKVSGFLQRMQSAEDVIQGFEGGAPQQQGGLTTRWTSYAPHSWQSDDAQIYNNAAKEWARAVLRKESGAVISDSEMQGVKEAYFPMPGDSQAAMENKRQLRATQLESMATEAGAPAPFGNQGGSDLDAELRKRGLTQ